MQRKPFFGVCSIEETAGRAGDVPRSHGAHSFLCMMDAVYWVCLLVGGFFVALSAFGGDADAEVEADLDVDAELDASGAELDAGSGLVDLFSVRTLFLFAAFFGLTGVLLSWAGTGEPLTGLLAGLTGLVVGLGGNYAIRRYGYRSVSSEIQRRDLQGKTAEVTIPFNGANRGKIKVVSKGHRLYLTARAFEGLDAGAFEPGDEVVIVRATGPVVEVVKPD